jgi:hypothetical protein
MVVIAMMDLSCRKHARRIDRLGRELRADAERGEEARPGPARGSRATAGADGATQVARARAQEEATQWPK